MNRRVLVVLNPTAGSVTDPALQEQEITDSFSKHGLQIDCIQFQSQEQWKKAVAAASPQYDLVIAAGGDGTVSSVAETLVGKKMTLGILPVGTGNVFAKALGIPVEVEAAIQVLVSGYEVKIIDSMRVNGRLALLNASVGLSSRTMGQTHEVEKKRLGMLAYFWQASKEIRRVKQHRFNIIVDDEIYIYRAAEIVVVNPNFMGIEPFSWGDDVNLDDGKVDLFVIRPRTVLDLLGFLGRIGGLVQRGSPTLKHLQAQRRIWFDSIQPQPVQIDGDVIGTTPVEIEVLPGSLKVAVPGA